MVVIGLVAAGAVAAALSTAGGLLIVISSSFAHDIYTRLINPQSSDRKRLLVARITIATATIVAGAVALDPPGVITQIVAWAFSLAAGTFFPVLVLGVWWKRTNAYGAIAGMLSGLTITITYIILARNGITLFNIGDTGAGVFGAPISFLITYFVSIFTKPPSQKVQDEVMDLRYPEQMTYKDGEVWLDDSKTS
jgi:cation/acetate symporter